MKKRLLSILLCACMVLILVPSIITTAAAAWDGSTATPVPETAADGSSGTGYYTVGTGAELAWIAEQVNNGTSTFSGKTVLLTSDIDLDGNPWTPIGTGGDTVYEFAGIFDGNGYEISGLTISAASGYQGLFGYVTGTITNLGVADSTISVSAATAATYTYTYIGGIAAYSTGEISGCYSAASVNTTVASAYAYPYTYIGGIAGYSTGTISDCSNTGTITATVTITAGYSARNYTYTGGLTGYSTGTISGCYNSGSIETDITTNSGSSYAYAGGVAGYNNNGTVSGCYNTDSVNLTVDLYANDAAWSAQYHAGGVAGCTYNGSIYNCYNTGTVTSSAELTKTSYDIAKIYAGGIAGSNYSTTVSSCTNTGSVSIEASDNTVNIYFKRIEGYAGGMAGYNTGTLYYCTNTGGVTADMNLTGNGFNAYSYAYIGGMAGYNTSSITYCYNTGIIDAYAYAHNNSGGMHGSMAYAGGIAGYNTATVSYCYNVAATVNASAGANVYNGTNQNLARAYAGGVVGYANSGTISYSYNASAVTADAFDARADRLIECAGCVVGYKGGGTVTSCYYDNEKCISGGINGSDTTGSAEGKATAVMQGDSLKTAESGVGWTDQHWLFEDSAYPVFGINIAGSNVSASAENRTYTGSALTTTLTLTNTTLSYTLQENTDYTITGYSNNIDAGTATVSVKGAGDYIWIRDITFTINPKDIGDSDVIAGSIASQTYTGSEIKPDFTLTYNGTALAAGTDYTISGYSNNINGGTATITVQGIGNYTGTRNLTFEIIQTHTVVYNANGGSGTITDPNSPYSANSTVTVLANSFTAPGATYVFVGWNTVEAGGGTAYTADDTFDITEDTTLYAQWAMETCDITLSALPSSIVGNGTSTTLLTATVTTEDGDPVENVEVTFTTSQYNETDNFFTDAACTIACRTAATNSAGTAQIYYRSTNLESDAAEPTIFDEKSFDVVATVADEALDLYATDSFTITFEPGTLEGILYDDTTGACIASTDITITLVSEDKTWSQTWTTDETGAYAGFVPLSGETYTISYTKTVETVDTDGGTVETDMTFSQNGTTGDTVGVGGTYDSDITITGLVLKENVEANAGMLLSSTDGYTVSVYKNDDEPVDEAVITFSANGQYTITKGLSDDTTYTVVVTYDADGQTLLAGSKTVTISSDGQMIISDVLIDPYGTITDANTGEAVDDVTVTLYYADTDTVVDLPTVSGFEPNENINPDTDADGYYAFMVYPNTDYYIVAEADGYQTYTSDTLSVGLTVLEHNIEMTKINAAAYFTLTFVSNGGSTINSVSRSAGTTVNLENYVPTRAGFTFTGWYSDSGLTVPVTSVKLTKNITVYAAWEASSDDESPDISGLLNTEDHMAYVRGYDDGTVRPEGSITRAESATMIYRLLTDEHRDEIFTAVSDFSDVTGDLWYNKAVSSMVNGGYIDGYDDGTFMGNQAITRAEFITTLVRFIGVDETAAVDFTDVSEDYWAYGYIATAVTAGWIEGYEDGTFMPDGSITRAEAITIINRVLERGIDEDSELPDGITAWPDVDTEDWYYYEIIEASNAHEYTGTRPDEDWTSLGIDYSYDMETYENP